MERGGPIPFVVHQIAPEEQIPDHFQAYRSSWTFWNPELELRLWTGSSLRALIVERAPWFLPLFDGVPYGLFQADLGRYLLLQQFGGLYADLDCQCLQPLAPLLRGRQLVLAPEPESREDHHSPSVGGQGIHRMVCPSFLASVPHHPLWRDVLAAFSRGQRGDVRACGSFPDAMGPGLLSRVVREHPLDEGDLVPAAWICPFSREDCRQGKAFDLQFWSERTREAFVAHHWLGSGPRPEDELRAGVPAQAPVSVHRPAAAPDQAVDAVAAPALASDAVRDQPLISCLMVTRGRHQLARLAIASFLQQTYPKRELVVVDDDSDSRLSDWIEAQASPLVRLVRLPDRGCPLGELRNLAVEQARGAYVCQWDDDDLSDPVRLEVQLQTLMGTGSQASLLARWMIWWPQRQRLALSCYRDWEGSLLCQRSLMPQYPARLRRGEDTVLLNRLLRSIRLARIDLPRLYLYVVHGANTFEASHFDRHWQHATVRWQGEALHRLWPELQRRLPMVAQSPCV